MIKKAFFSGLIFFIITGSSLFAQQSEQSIETLLKEALSLHIHAMLSQNQENVLWESEVVKLTIPGRPVTLHLQNEQAKLSVHFTPYRKTEGGLILIAQSEIWLVKNNEEENGNQGIRYYTSMKSIPLDYGEQVLFFPLGKMDNLNNPEKLHIEMAVLISPYLQNDEEASEDAAPESEANITEDAVN